MSKDDELVEKALQLRIKVSILTANYGAYCATNGTQHYEHMEKDMQVVDDILAIVTEQVTLAKAEAAKYIQGKLMADEPEVIASNRGEDKDRGWFAAQLVFSNYLNDDVIEPYISSLTNNKTPSEDK